MGKKIVRLYTGPDGESHFEDIEWQAVSGFDPESKYAKATGIGLWENDGKHDHGWHNAPRRLYLIALEGESEMEVGDGTLRRFGPGDIILVEDTTGRGHTTRSVNKQPRKAIVVTLD